MGNGVGELVRLTKVRKNGIAQDHAEVGIEPTTSGIVEQRAYTLSHEAFTELI